MFCLSMGLLTCSAALGLSPPPGTVITNRAEAEYADAVGNPMPTASGQVETVLAEAPVLRVQKLASSDPVAMGDLLTYTIEYENTGNAAAADVTVRDVLPRHVEFQSASAGGIHTPDPPQGGTVTWGVGTLASDQGGSVTVLVRVRTPDDYPPGDPDAIQSGTVLENTVTATSIGASAEDSISTTVGESPGLRVSKSGTPHTVPPGGTVTYVIDYGNVGNRAASDVRVRDELPTGTAYVPGSATGDAMLEGRTVVWHLGDVPVGAAGQLSFQVTVSPLAGDGEIVSNRATILSREQGPLPSNQVVTYVTTASLLSIAKADEPDPVRVGDEITYALSLRNDGAIPLTNVVVTDALPTGTAFVSADAGGVLVGGEVEWHLGALAPGEEAVLQLVVQVLPPAQPGQVILNTFVVSSTESAPRSVSAATEVTCRTPGQVAFMDDSWNPTGAYGIGDTICVQVADEDRNLDDGTVETVEVILESEAGDTETLLLAETGPDTGIFRGCLPSTGGISADGDGVLRVGQDTGISATYTDPLDSFCFPPLPPVTALIDPFGIVFDSVTGAPIGGAVVTLIDAATGLPAATGPDPNPVTTGADGKFAFPSVAAGSYYLDVAAGADYAYPSVVPDGELPAGYVIGLGSRGETFALVPGMLPLNVDVPVDPPAGEFRVTKDANVDGAAVGDLVRYTVTVKNAGPSPVTSVSVVDTMPHGVQYVEDSTRLAGKKWPDPALSGKRPLVWQIPDVDGGESVELVYDAIVGPDSQRGDGKNTVFATGRSVGRTITSNTARFRLRVNGGVFTERGTIIGKVFIDLDGDGLQGTGEAGVAGVALYLEDGTRVVTDIEGKFSIPAVRPGTHVLELDRTTLPLGLAPAPVSNRFMGDDASQFVDLVRGGLLKANFAVLKTERPVHLEDSAGGADSAAAATPQPEADAESTQQERPSQPLEKRIKELSPELDFLSPQDGAVASRGHVNVLVKAPLGDRVTLHVNDEEVPGDKVGRTVTSQPNRVAVYEFISVELPPGRESILRAVMHDQWGNARGEREVKVRVEGPPAQLQIEPTSREVPADGSSTTTVTVRVLDRNGFPATAVGSVTVDVSAGKVLDEDIDPFATGLQLACEDGVAGFTLQAPWQMENARITAICDAVEAEEEVFFAPHLRPMFVVGAGEVTIGSGHTSGDFGPLEDEEWFDEGTYGEARGAFFLKGKVGEDVLVTAAYDSEKEKEDELFRARDTDTDSEERYPVYGDESEVGYEAMSRDGLYVRVDKGKSHLLYGDYYTKLDDTRLAAYNRAFTGVKTEVEGDKFRLDAFATYTDRVQAVDSIRGKGISGYYFLSESHVVEGSEMVVIETRDRWRPERVLSRESMARETDYDIDYDTGGILFKSAVPSRDEDLNPVFIVVSYETEDSAENHYTYGGRAAYRPADWLEVGCTHVTKEQEADDYRLLGADAKLDLPGATTVRAEWVESEALFEIDSVLQGVRDNGWAVTLTSNPFDGCQFEGYYQNIGDSFWNPSAFDVMRGTEKHGVAFQYELAPQLQLTGDYFDEADTLNESEYRHASLGVERTWGGTKVAFELAREASDDQFIPPGGPTTRWPFDISEQTPHRATTVGVSVETELTPKLSVNAGHKQDVQGGRHNLSSLGLDYRFDDLTKLYLREEYARYEERSESRTALGVESRVAKNTVVFDEYRLLGSVSGSATQQAIGLRNKFMWTEDVTGNVSLEKVSTFRGDEDQDEPDGLAVTAALEYLPSDDVKLTTHGEYLHSTLESIHLAEAGLTCKLTPDYSLLLRERFFNNDFDGGGRHTISRSLLGLAYRPVDQDRFNALAKLEFKHEKDTSAEPTLSTNAYIGSVEGVYQADRRLQLIGKYAGKLVVDGDSDNYTDLVSGRIIYDLSDRFDVGVEYRMLTSHGVNSRAHGGSAEVGYRLARDFWLSLGYRFDKFDADLTQDDYWGKGPFLRLRMKF